MGRRVVIALAVAVVLCGALFGVHRWRQFARLEGVKAELRAEGIPLTREGLEAKYAVPDDLQALVDEACAILRDDDADEKLMFYLLTRSSGGIGSIPDTISRMDVTLTPHYTPALAFLEEAGAHPALGVRSFGTFRQEEEWYRNAMFRAAKLFTMRARERIREGDVDGAVSDMVACRRLVWLLDPMTGAGAQVDARVLGELAWLIGTVSLSSENLDRIEAAWRPEGERERMRIWAAYRAIWTLGISSEGVVEAEVEWLAFEASQARVTATLPERVVAFIYAPRESTYWLHEPADLAWCLESYVETVRAANALPTQWSIESLPFFSASDEIPRGYLRAVQATRFGWQLEDLLRQGAMASRLVTTVVAIERYRRDHDRVPSNLAELVPGYLHDLPIDPWEGKPLKVIRSDYSYFVSIMNEYADPLSGVPKVIEIGTDR